MSPRGVKAQDYPSPEVTLCDFCGRKFKPLAWNERTCYRCERDGFPNQSKSDWGAYSTRLGAILRAMGKRPKLAGAAAVAESTGAAGKVR